MTTVALTATSAATTPFGRQSDEQANNATTEDVETLAARSGRGRREVIVENDETETDTEYELSGIEDSEFTDEEDDDIRSAAIGTTNKHKKRITHKLRCSDHTAKCFKIECFLTNLQAGGSSRVIKVSARLWNNTLAEDFRHVDVVLIGSHAMLEILSDNIIQEDEKNDHAIAVTLAYPDIRDVVLKKPIPVWVIVLSVLGGIAALAILVAVFYALGFFKRKQFTDEEFEEAKMREKGKKRSKKTPDDD